MRGVGFLLLTALAAGVALGSKNCETGTTAGYHCRCNQNLEDFKSACAALIQCEAQFLAEVARLKPAPSSADDPDALQNPEQQGGTPAPTRRLNSPGGGQVSSGGDNDAATTTPALDDGVVCRKACQDNIDLAYKSGCVRIGDNSEAVDFAQMCDKAELITHTHEPSGAVRMPTTKLPLQANFKAAAVAMQCSGCGHTTPGIGLASAGILLFFGLLSRLPER